jgi:hypothetical protein
MLPIHGDVDNYALKIKLHENRPIELTDMVSEAE